MRRVRGRVSTSSTGNDFSVICLWVEPMLVSFSVTNFRSFREEQTISLVASKRFAEDHPEHTVAIPGTDERVLRFGVLYGANGAGKSNLLKALQFVRGTALAESAVTYEPFRFGPPSTEPTVFDLQFMANGRLFRFGLAFDERQIIDEFLIQGTGENEVILFERSVDSNGLAKVNIPEIPELTDEKLVFLAKVGVLPKRTFLGTVYQNIGPFDDQPESHRLAPALLWMVKLGLFQAGQRFLDMPGTLERDADLRGFASQFLASAHTGVEEIRTVRKPYANVEGFHEIALETAHTNAQLPLEEESDGTQRLVDLARILHSLAGAPGSCVIDEIERSLHPLLVHKILNDFLLARGQGQLVVTTHDASLLDLGLLRRDEIWFAEKDPRGATHLYSLSDYPVRNDEIQKHYRQGRFGAVPFLEGMNLMEPNLK